MIPALFPTQRGSRQGTILVAVLWILIFLGFLAVVLRMHMSGVVASVRAAEEKEAVRVLADAGLEMAAALVRAGPQDGVGVLPDIIAGSVQTATGSVAITATNEALRIDINTGARPLIEGGLIAAGASDGAARRIAEDIVTRRGTTTTSPPQEEPQTPQQASKEKMLQSVSQLATAASLTNDVALEAERYFTVSSGLEGARLDQLDDRVLASIPDIPANVVKAIRDYRQGKITRDQMRSAASQVPYYTEDQAISWRVGLSASLPSGYSESYEAVVIISPEANAPYLVVDWRRR